MLITSVAQLYVTPITVAVVQVVRLVVGSLSRKFIRLPLPAGFIKNTVADVAVASRPVVGTGNTASVAPNHGVSVPVTSHDLIM